MDKGRIYPVYLRIENPIQFIDEDYFHDSKIYTVLIQRNEQLPSQMREEAEQILSSGRSIRPNTVINLMHKYGYDGFVYQNTAEDVGSRSWIITDPNQVLYAYSK